jgi:hypothetical protein
VTPRIMNSGGPIYVLRDIGAELGAKGGSEVVSKFPRRVDAILNADEMLQGFLSVGITHGGIKPVSGARTLTGRAFKPRRRLSY